MSSDTVHTPVTLRSTQVRRALRLVVEWAAVTSAAALTFVASSAAAAWTVFAMRDVGASDGLRLAMDLASLALAVLPLAATWLVARLWVSGRFLRFDLDGRLLTLGSWIALCCLGALALNDLMPTYQDPIWDPNPFVAMLLVGTTAIVAPLVSTLEMLEAHRTSASRCHSDS